jgi:hypothetical protein
MSAANGICGKRSWDESPISCIAYETYRSELVTCDDVVVVELEDFSGVCNNCSLGFSTRGVDIDVGLVWTGDEEGRIILCPCNAWINSSESSSVFVGDRSRTRVNGFDGNFSICVIADVWEKGKIRVLEIMNKVFLPNLMEIHDLIVAGYHQSIWKKRFYVIRMEYLFALLELYFQ